MGKVTEQGIIGTVGNLNFYSVNGKNYVRKKPRKRKKKRGQKEPIYVSIFRSVSSYGTKLAVQLDARILYHLGRDGYNQLRGWMWKQYAAHNDEQDWKLTALNIPCSLNKEADFAEFLKVNYTISDGGTAGIYVSIPSINPKKDLRVPTRTTKVNLKCVAVGIRFDKLGAIPGVSVQEYEFPYSDKQVPAQELKLDTGSKKDDIVIVAMALEFKTSRQPLLSKDQRWLPVAVVAMGRKQ